MVSFLNLTFPLLLSLAAGGLEWYDDYGAALLKTKQTHRPLLVVLDTQSRSLAHVEPVSQGAQRDRDVLLAKYTLCHVDATTAYGGLVARAFRAKAFPATVIIDNSGSVRLVSKTGKLSADELHAMLVKYADGQRPAAPVCRT